MNHRAQEEFKQEQFEEAPMGSIIKISRIARYQKAGRYAKAIGAGSPIYLAAVLEYIAQEILELARAEAIQQKKKRVNPDHIVKAISKDPELQHFLRDAKFCNAGYAPKIKPKVDTGKKTKKVEESDDDFQ